MKRTIADKILKDRPYEIDRSCNSDGYQKVLASMVYQFFDKKTGSGAAETSKAGVSVNEKLAKEWRKQVTKTFKITRVYERFKGNIWAGDLPEMEKY